MCIILLRLPTTGQFFEVTANPDDLELVKAVPGISFARNHAILKDTLIVYVDRRYNVEEVWNAVDNVLRNKSTEVEA